MATFVIGLGGTGKTILLALKKMIAENSQNAMEEYPSLEFLSIDTDNNPASYETYSEISTIDRNELRLDPEKEIFSLNVNYTTLPDLKADFPKIHEWFPTSLESALAPSSFEVGTGGRKPVGRFAFAWNADELFQKLSLLLQKLVNEQNTNKNTYTDYYTTVFICGSLAGGTGSGIFLDIAYMIRYIENIINTKRLFIYSMFALSSLFSGPGMSLSTEANCYASLKELDFFMNKCNYKNPEHRFHPAYKDSFHHDYSNAANNPPFDYTFLFDKTNNTGNSLDSIKAFGELCAKFIYSLSTNSIEKDNKIADQWMAVNNCLMPKIEHHYNRGKYNKPINYYSMGNYSIIYPRKKIIYLCACKLTAAYLNQLVTESSDKYQIKDLQDKLKHISSQSKLLEPSNNCELLFDYEKDVETIYKSVIAEKGEDYILKDLHEKVNASQNQNLLHSILCCAEEYFTKEVNKINITDKLLADEEKLKLLIDGTYFNKAACYLDLNIPELESVNLSINNSSFYTILIPHEYCSKRCDHIKGFSGEKCPMEANPEMLKSEHVCPMYGKCLKKILLDNSPRPFLIELTNNNSEITIIRTTAAFPLHALNTAAKVKIQYDAIREKNAREQDAGNQHDERIHCFGTFEFDDLFEKTKLLHNT